MLLLLSVRSSPFKARPSTHFTSLFRLRQDTNRKILTSLRSDFIIALSYENQSESSLRFAGWFGIYVNKEVREMAKTGTQVAPMRTVRGISRDPFRELFDLQRGINELFDEGFGGSRESVGLRAWSPAVDVY